MKYRKKPVIIDAVLWRGNNQREVANFLEGDLFQQEEKSFRINEGKNFLIDFSRVQGGLIIKTLEGEHIASLGDYIIRGIKGEFYPCKPDIFEQTYEAVEDDSDDDSDDEGKGEDEETKPKYDYFTPFDDLSDNLKAIVTALETIDPKEWNRSDDDKRKILTKTTLEPLNLVGRLDNDELDYLEDCNYHTALNYLMSREN